MGRASNTLIAYLRSLATRPREGDSGDGELLRRFVQTRDGDAFAALMRRHGPLVLGLARRVGGAEDLAEDVFQATFLLLSQKAHTIRQPESLSCWLHSIAHRLAVQARRAHLRRPRHEAKARPPSPPNPLDELTAQEFLTVLDDELQKLSENQRAPLILCCLEGLSQEEAAKRLGCSTDAVRGRLERGRQRLRQRLEKRGLTLPTVLGGTLLLTGAPQAVSAALMQTTLKAATGGVGMTPTVAALIQEAMHTMFVHKLKMIAVAGILFALGGTGVGMMALRPHAAKESVPPVAADDKPLSPAPRVDLYGDPLPEGVALRLGTLQRRAVGAQMAVTADGKSIVTVRGGKYVSIWDADTGKLRERRELPLPFRGISYLSPDGCWLANLGDDNSLMIWNMDKGKIARKLSLNGVYDFQPVVFSTDGKQMAAVGHIGNQRTVRIWDMENGREIWRKQFDTNFVCPTLALAPDGKRLLVAFDRFMCWDYSESRQLWEKKDYSSESLVITPDGQILSSGSLYPALDLATGRTLDRKRLPRLDSEIVSRLTLSPDGRTLLLSTEKGIVVWDRDKGENVRTLEGAGELVAFLRDGKSIIANNGSLQRWELTTGKPRWRDTFEWGHVGEVLGLAFLANGRQLISSSADGSLRLWDTATGRQQRLWRAHSPSHRHSSQDGVKLMDITPDGRWILSAGGDDEIKLWETARDAVVHVLKLPPATKEEYYRTIYRLRINPEGTRAAALFAPRMVLQTQGQPKRNPAYKLATWDTQSGKLLSCPVVETKNARRSALSPDGRTLLADGWLVDAVSGREIGRLQNPVLTYSFVPPPSAPYVFSADGSLLLSNRFDHEPGTHRVSVGARRWETATGKEIGEVVLPAFGQIAFHPNNRFLITNEREYLQIWHASSGKKVAERKVPEQVWSSDSWYRYASCLAATRDGRRLAAGMPDGTILLWDVTLPPQQNETLSAKELESLWTDLADADAAKAWRAVERLADAPKDALVFLRGRVKPYPTAATETTRKLLEKLDGDSFENREAATKRLKELGLQAEPALRAALQTQPSLEQRKRIEPLLAALTETPEKLTADDLRQLRALIVLERIALPEARRMLEAAAKGPPSARLTRQARSALACRPKVTIP